jgi:hypothetical protein
MATTNNLTINTALLIKPARDELYKEELIDQHRLIKKLKEELRAEELKRNKLSVLNSQSRGVEPAYIGSGDLVKIIQDLLANKSTVSKAFQRHEVNKIKTAEALNAYKKLNGFNVVNTNMCTDWAKRTKKYSIDKIELSSALKEIAKDTDIMLIRKHKVLDVKDIERSASYSAALTKLRKQQGIAHALQDKDNQLINKDSVIAAKDAEIEKIKKELQRDKSEDCETRIYELKDAGISVTDIAARVGKARATVYAFLKKRQLNLKLLSD